MLTSIAAIRFELVLSLLTTALLLLTGNHCVAMQCTQLLPACVLAQGKESAEAMPHS